ncbi:MAG: Bro-N domain-containing protein [Candidatus Gracilibacteria bacterium]|nr:Bro-N domain-containing protein [Candidatus Gracilibacteria bacterium]
METKLAIFQEKEIRRIWDSEKGDWYFSVIDIVGVLTEQEDYKKAKSYWTTLKNRLKKEGSQVVTDCDHLKMKALDGKMRKTDVLDTKGILRLIQSIPSKKAEPFKMWLAKVGDERINEIYDPELAIERAISTYRKKGYSEDWIQQRLKSIDIRKELTGEWKERGIKEGVEYAILTNEILKGWSGMTTGEYKNLKGLKKESLKDNMSNLELVFNMLGEVSTTEIMKTRDVKGFKEVKEASKQGGTISGNARKELEQKTNKKVISDKNNLEVGKNTKKLKK